MRFAIASHLITLLVPITTLSAQESPPVQLDPRSLQVQSWVWHDPVGKLGVPTQIDAPFRRTRPTGQSNALAEDTTGCRVVLLNPGTMRTRYSKDRAPVPPARRRGPSVGEYIATVVRVFSGFDYSPDYSDAGHNLLMSLLRAP
jgi:hypothetical protein